MSFVVFEHPSGQADIAINPAQVAAVARQGEHSLIKLVGRQEDILVAGLLENVLARLERPYGGTFD
jgi:hypothetical protein